MKRRGRAFSFSFSFRIRICSSAHLLICSSAHLLICSSAICSAARLLGLASLTVSQSLRQSTSPASALPPSTPGLSMLYPDPCLHSHHGLNPSSRRRQGHGSLSSLVLPTDLSFAEISRLTIRYASARNQHSCMPATQHPRCAAPPSRDSLGSPPPSNPDFTVKAPMEIMECVYGFREDRFGWAFLWSPGLLIGSIVAAIMGPGPVWLPPTDGARSTQFWSRAMGERDTAARQSWSRERGTGSLAWQRHWGGHVRYSLILTTASAHHGHHHHRLAVLQSTM